MLKDKNIKKKKAKGMARAYASKDSYRLTSDGSNIPLINDTTEYITPEIAEKMLQNNKANRPVGWNKVEQYKKMMLTGEWKFHSQGIILDDKNNILTGQKRLWAVILSGIPQYFRVSRGTPSNTSHLIDRGTPQSARDLASRLSERKHSPTEGSIARAMFAVDKKIRPSVDEMAFKIVECSELLEIATKQLRGTKKTKGILMITGAICWLAHHKDSSYIDLFALTTELERELNNELSPMVADECWNKGIAFTMAMNKSIEICKRFFT